MKSSFLKSTVIIEVQMYVLFFMLFLLYLSSCLEMEELIDYVLVDNFSTKHVFSEVEHITLFLLYFVSSSAVNVISALIY